MQSFGNEVFSSTIRDLRFDTVKLNFKSLDRYTLVFVNPLDTDDQFIQQKLQEVGGIFQDKYAEKVRQHTLTEEMYLNFMDDIVDIGLVAKDRIKSTRDLFISDTETVNKENKSMFDKFKEKFTSLIKR